MILRFRGWQLIVVIVALLAASVGGARLLWHSLPTSQEKEEAELPEQLRGVSPAEVLVHASELSEDLPPVVVETDRTEPKKLTSSEIEALKREFRLNINTASIKELRGLPGVGPSRAKTIVAYREENGPFYDLDELANLSGISQSTVEELRRHATTK